MVEWFKNLSEVWQTAIFGAAVAVALAVIGGLFGLFKCLFGRKDAPAPQQKTIHQEGSRHTPTTIDGDKNIIAGRDIHTGINEDVLNAALKALNTALSMVDTDQSKNLVSELKKISDEKLSTPIELVQDKHNNQQKLQLEKEFKLYGELWKALVDVRSSIIITPTLDRMPKGKSPYDVYKERCDITIDAFNKAKNLFEKNRPFYHTKELLGRCRGYIFKVQRAISSGKFDDRLHDEADELLEIIPKAIDEIEKAIKVGIGLLPISEVDDRAPIAPGLGSIVEITNGSIMYKSNTLNFKPLIGLKMSIIGGYVKRNDFGKLEAYIQTDIPFQSLQRLNERLGLDSMRLLSENHTISQDIDNPVVFTSSTSHILPQGEMVLDLSTWQEGPFPMNMHVQTQTTASGHLKGKVFQGKFEAILTYHEINLQIGLNGDFQVHLS
jgi:hypothetical protein